MRAIVIALAILFAPAMALAQAPSTPAKNINAPEKFIRIGSPFWGIRMSVPTTTRPVRNNQSGATAITDLRLFSFDSVINISCVAQAGFCFSQTSSVVLSTGNQFGHMFDIGNSKFGQTAGTSGVGPCFIVEPGIPYSVTLFREVFSGPQASTVAARDGVCINSTSGATDGWPCNADADCSSGTCSRANTGGNNGGGRTAKSRQKGAFLLGIAPSATTCSVSQDY